MQTLIDVAQIAAALIYVFLKVYNLSVAFIFRFTSLTISVPWYFLDSPLQSLLLAHFIPLSLSTT